MLRASLSEMSGCTERIFIQEVYASVDGFDQHDHVTVCIDLVDSNLEHNISN